MKSLQEIKDEYAIELGYIDFDNILYIRFSYAVEVVMEEVAKRYALEVAKETQRRCAANVEKDICLYLNDDMLGWRDIESAILSETNIPKLI